MIFSPSFRVVSTATLAITFLLAGCKSNTAPPPNQINPTAENSQPAAAQPAPSQPAPSQPVASQPAGQPASGQAASDQPAAMQPGAPGQPATSAAQQSVAPPPPPAVITLPAGTAIRVRLVNDLGSKISQPGDTFTATVADSVMKNGVVVIPKGARADGTVIDAKPLGKFKGGALLSIKLDRVRTKWGSYPVATSTVSQTEQGKGKRSAGLIGGGAGLGAVIGGIAGGGKGAAIGALAGGGAGTAGSAFTGNKQIVLPAETLVTFALDHSVHITQKTPADQPELQER
jgi:hypothetical protein